MDRTTAANFIMVDGKRKFTDGPPATCIDADHLNAVQEEIMAVIEGAGLTPSANDLTQLKQGIKSYIGIGRLNNGSESSPAYTTIDSGTAVSPGRIKTVGPTGSGADVIWPQMDNIPVGAKAIVMLVELYATTNVDVYVYFHSGDDNYIYAHATNYYSTAGTAHQHVVHQTVIVPLDSGRKWKSRFYNIDNNGVFNAQAIGYLF